MLVFKRITSLKVAVIKAILFGKLVKSMETVTNFFSGDLLELSSPEMLDEFKGLVIGSCVQLKVVSMPRKFSNDPFLCNLQLVSQGSSSYLRQFSLHAMLFNVFSSTLTVSPSEFY